MSWTEILNHVTEGTGYEYLMGVDNLLDIPAKWCDECGEWRRRRCSAATYKSMLRFLVDYQYGIEILVARNEPFTDHQLQKICKWGLVEELNVKVCHQWLTLDQLNVDWLRDDDELKIVILQIESIFEWFHDNGYQVVDEPTVPTHIVATVLGDYTTTVELLCELKKDLIYYKSVQEGLQGVV